MMTSPSIENPVSDGEKLSANNDNPIIDSGPVPEEGIIGENSIRLTSQNEETISESRGQEQSHDDDPTCGNCFPRRKSVEKSPFDEQLAVELSTARPLLIKILSNSFFDCVFSISALMSYFFVLFSEAFLLESRTMWGIISFNSFIYTCCMLAQWIHSLEMASYTKMKFQYSIISNVLHLMSVLPFDSCILVLYSTYGNMYGRVRNPFADFITISRLPHLLRIRTLWDSFAKWESRMMMGDLKMFVLKTTVYIFMLLHFLACSWHRIACRPFTPGHFTMRPVEATIMVCRKSSWVMDLLVTPSPLFKKAPIFKNGVALIFEHYFGSLYWAVTTLSRLGTNEIKPSVDSELEIGFVAVAQIISWIFLIFFVSGNLTFILVEKNAEQQNFLSKRFAIDKHLEFCEVGPNIIANVSRFYDYMWTRSRGIHNWHLVRFMPMQMRREIYFDINKYVLDKLPLLAGLDDSFLMAISAQMRHTFFLRGEVLQKRGENGYAMYYVINGHLEVLDEDEQIVLTEIRSGSVIGEMNLLQPIPVIATVKCGTECEVMILEKAKFRKVLELYPDYGPILRKRTESRLDQANLLLALCEKYNQYPRTIGARILHLTAYNTTKSDDKERQSSYEMVTQALGNPLQPDLVKPKTLDRDDFDDISLPHEIKEKLMKTDESGMVRRITKTYMSAQEALVAGCVAIENDVSKATSIAKDLTIPRPPLQVKTPTKYSNVLPHDRKFIGSYFPKFSSTESAKLTSDSVMIWKSFVFFSIILYLLIQPYEAVFGNPKYYYTSYILHGCDLVFLLDFVYDMTRPVILPHNTLESHKEILKYHSKTIYFYLRLFAFLPIEYMIGPICKWKHDEQNFKLLRFNRFILYWEGIKLFKLFDGTYRIPAELIISFRFCLRLLLLLQVFAIFFKWERGGQVLEEGKPKEYSYEFAIYLATEIMTTTGYGDFFLDDYSKILTTTVGVSLGACMLIYMNGRLSATMSNGERQRVMFRQTVSRLMKFMSNRKFSKMLVHKIKRYYRLQWVAHQGALIPGRQSVLSGVPKTLLYTVTKAQTLSYVDRIPLFKDCDEGVRQKICAGLKQYMVPPKFVLLHPEDPSRDLYIIVSGYCKVSKGGKHMGTLSQGSYFGIGGLVYGKNGPHLIQSLNYCSFFCLEFKTFAEIAKNHNRFLFEYRVLRGDAVIPEYFNSNTENLFPLHSKSMFPNSKGELTHSNDKLNKTATLHHLHSDTQNKSSSLPKLPLVQFPKHQLKSTTHLINFQQPNFEQRRKVLKSNPSNIFLSTRPYSRFPNPAGTSHLQQLSPTYMEATVGAEESNPSVNTNAGVSIYWSKLEGPSSSSHLLRFIPFGRFMKIWTMFRIVCAVCAGNFALLQAFFPVHPTRSLIVTFALDLVAWVDMLICCRVAFFGPKKQLIYNWWETSKHYFKGSFLLDFLACFPLELVVIASDPNIRAFTFNYHYNDQFALISFLRLNRLLQCYRILVCGRILNQIVLKSASLLTLVQVVPIMWLFLTVMSCFAVGMICKPSTNGGNISCDPTSWLMNRNSLFYNSSSISPEDILTDPLLAYIVSLYWVLTSAFCVGFGDLNSIETPLSRRIATTVIFSGTIVTGFLVSKLTAALVGEDARRLELREKSKILGKFLKEYDVPLLLRRRLKQYYYSEWDKTQGVYPRDLFAALPPGLKADAMKTLYEEKIRTAPIFISLDDVGRRFLSSILTDMFFPEGEFVFSCGDLNGDTYYVSKGLLATYRENGDLIQYLGEGSLIGEISCLFEVQRMFSAVAVTDVEIYMFPKEDFLDFLSLYPNIRKTIEEFGIRHFQEMRDLGSVSQRPMSNIGSIASQASRLSDESYSISSCFTQILDPNLDPLRPRPIIPHNLNATTSSLEPSSGWKSFFLTFGNLPRDEMGLLHIIQDRASFRWYTAVFHPSSPICSWVTGFLVITALSCGFTACEIAFFSEEQGESWPVFMGRMIIELFFIIKLLGSFRLAFFNESGVLVTNPRLIANRYFTQPLGFWFDMLTTFPFYTISYFGNNENKALSADIRSLQFLRVFLFSRYLKEKETELRMKLSLIRMVKISALLCFIFHFFACAWYVTACRQDGCVEGSWVTILLDRMKTEGKIRNASEVWISQRYVWSLYYVATAMTFTGFSEITPRTTIELCFTICIIFTTIFVVGFLVGEMTQSLGSQVASKIHFQHQINVMEHHFTTLGLSWTKMQQLVNYFRMLWLRCNGKIYTDILAELPHSLRADITMKIYGPSIKQSKIFGNLEDKLIRQLTTYIQHEIFLPGTSIARRNDVCKAVYFIMKGEVAILDENHHVNLCVDILREGECFGEVKVMLEKEFFRFSYIAKVETDVGVLKEESLYEVLSKVPSVHEEIKSRAQKAKLARITASASASQL